MSWNHNNSWQMGLAPLGAIHKLCHSNFPIFLPPSLPMSHRFCNKNHSKLLHILITPPSTLERHRFLDGPYLERDDRRMEIWKIMRNMNNESNIFQCGPRFLIIFITIVMYGKYKLRPTLCLNNFTLVYTYSRNVFK